MPSASASARWVWSEGKVALTCLPAQRVLHLAHSSSHLSQQNALSWMAGRMPTCPVSHLRILLPAQEREPGIHGAIQFGAVLENVTFDEDSREVRLLSLLVCLSALHCVMRSWALSWPTRGNVIAGKPQYPASQPRQPLVVLAAGRL